MYVTWGFLGSRRQDIIRSARNLWGSGEHLRSVRGEGATAGRRALDHDAGLTPASRKKHRRTVVQEEPQTAVQL